MGRAPPLGVAAGLRCFCCAARLPSFVAGDQMAEEGDDVNNLEALKRAMQYALIKNCDMNEEMRSDCVDAVISATEK